MEDIETKLLEHKNNIKKLNDQLTSLKDKNDLITLEKEAIKKCNNNFDIDVIEELINSLNDLK